MLRFESLEDRSLLSAAPTTLDVTIVITGNTVSSVEVSQPGIQDVVDVDIHITPPPTSDNPVPLPTDTHVVVTPTATVPVPSDPVTTPPVTPPISTPIIEYHPHHDDAFSHYPSSFLQENDDLLETLAANQVRSDATPIGSTSSPKLSYYSAANTVLQSNIVTLQATNAALQTQVISFADSNWLLGEEVDSLEAELGLPPTRPQLA
jgi:hypothetical protein